MTGVQTCALPIYEVALVVAAGDHAHGAAGIQQGVDGPDGLVAVVGEDHDVAGGTGSLDFWTGLYAAVNAYVDRFTLADLVREELAKSGEAPISSGT